MNFVTKGTVEERNWITINGDPENTLQRTNSGKVKTNETVNNTVNVASWVTSSIKT